ncbi:MAG: hypothetical protein AAF125_24790, partial [Chloroflexota bacterium]
EALDMFSEAGLKVHKAGRAVSAETYANAAWAYALFGDVTTAADNLRQARGNNPYIVNSPVYKRAAELLPPEVAA